MKLQCAELLSSFAFNFNFRRFSKVADELASSNSLGTLKLTQVGLDGAETVFATPASSPTNSMNAATGIHTIKFTPTVAGRLRMEISVASDGSIIFQVGWCKM